MIMKTRTLLSIGLSVLVLSGTMTGAATPGMIAAAASAENPKQAASQAGKARRAIAKRDAVKAVRYAEGAVSFAPMSAEYRALLGQAYLLAGRFTSAKQALTDALTLDAADPRIALNLALSEIAIGDWSGARGTLEAHPEIAPSDRGLAFALAGDPMKAIDILGPAAREPDASAKTRQNLALSLALAGRWQEAKTIAAIDLAPDQVDQRIMQWAAFARPSNAYDQVASLLGVTAIEDAGQPTRLALAMPDPQVQVAAAEPASEPVNALDAYMPGVPASADTIVAENDVRVPSLDAEPEPEPTQVAGTGPQIVFGPREEIVQPIPTPTRRPTPAPVAVAARDSTVAMPAKGSFYVQLGAYSSPGVARDAWRRVSVRVPAVGRHTPQSARVTTKAGSFFRLSVGGFARNDADALCGTVKAKGGACFVRAGAGDQVASWARRTDTEVASR